MRHTRAEFEVRLQGFVHAANRVREEHRATHYASLPEYKPLELMHGQRYVRVVNVGDKLQAARSVYCFVDIETGDVLKAATWKAPAKHSRANVYNEDYGVSGVGPYGAKYLR